MHCSETTLGAPSATPNMFLNLSLFTAAMGGMGRIWTVFGGSVSRMLKAKAQRVFPVLILMQSGFRPVYPHHIELAHKELRLLRQAHGLPDSLTFGALRRLTYFRLYKAGVNPQLAARIMGNSVEIAMSRVPKVSPKRGNEKRRNYGNTRLHKGLVPIAQRIVYRPPKPSQGEVYATVDERFIGKREIVREMKVRAVPIFVPKS